MCAAISICALLIAGCRSPGAVPPHEVTVALDAPDAAWSIHIEEVHRTGGELWVFSQLRRQQGAMAAQVITTVSDTVRLHSRPLGVRHFVAGRTWNWENRSDITFLDGRTDFHRSLPQNSVRIYSRPD